MIQLPTFLFKFFAISLYTLRPYYEIYYYILQPKKIFCHFYIFHGKESFFNLIFVGVDWQHILCDKDGLLCTKFLNFSHACITKGPP